MIRNCFCGEELPLCWFGAQNYDVACVCCGREFLVRDGVMIASIPGECPPDTERSPLTHEYSCATRARCSDLTD